MTRIAPRRALGLVGILFVLAYLNHALGWGALPPRLSLAFAFGLGPGAVLGVLSISGRLESGYPTGLIRAGRVTSLRSPPAEVT